MNLTLKNLYRISYIFKNFFKQKKQKWFYDLENYKNIINIKKKSFYIFYNFIFNIDDCLKKNSFKKNLSNLYKEVILIFIPKYSSHLDIFNFKNKFYLLNYFLNSKKYNRKLFAGPNFLKIDLSRKKILSLKKILKIFVLNLFLLKKILKKDLYFL